MMRLPLVVHILLWLLVATIAAPLLLIAGVAVLAWMGAQ